MQLRGKPVGPGQVSSKCYVITGTGIGSAATSVISLILAHEGYVGFCWSHVPKPKQGGIMVGIGGGREGTRGGMRGGQGAPVTPVVGYRSLHVVTDEHSSFTRLDQASAPTRNRTRHAHTQTLYGGTLRSTLVLLEHYRGGKTFVATTPWPNPGSLVLYATLHTVWRGFFSNALTRLPATPARGIDYLVLHKPHQVLLSLVGNVKDKLISALRQKC